MTITAKEACLQRVSTEIKLLINKRLYEKGIITEEMYTGATNSILKEAKKAIDKYSESIHN